MKVNRSKCDNPKCDQEGIPESEDMGGKYCPPYGWYLVDLTVIGSGPQFVVEVCNLPCLEPAIAAKFDEYHRVDG